MKPFEKIGSQWMLISAEKDGKVNTMTASWGGVGVLWGKNVVTVYIRPQRYTKEFVDANDTFTLSFFDGNYMKELGYLGKVSGRKKLWDGSICGRRNREHHNAFCSCSRSRAGRDQGQICLIRFF